MASWVQFFVSLAVLLSTVLPDVSLAAPAEYPDRVDRFRIIHEQTQGISQEARRQANVKASTHRQRVGEREGLEAERNGLVNHVTLNRSSIEAINQSNTSLLGEVNRAQASIRENTVTRENLQVEADRLQTAITVARDELVSANATVTSGNQALNTAKDSLREATTELTRVQGELRAARERVTNASGEMTRQSTEITRLEARVRELTAQRQGFTSELERLNARMQTQRERAIWLVSALEVIGEDLTDMAGQKTQLESQMATLRHRATQESQRAAALQTELQTLVTQKQNAERAITETEQKIRTEQTALSALDIEKLRLEESIPLLQGELDRLLRETPPSTPQIDAARAQVTRARQELLAIPGKRAEVRTRIATLETELSQKRTEIVAIDRRSTEATQARVAVVAALEQTNLEIESKTRLLGMLNTRRAEIVQEQTEKLQEQRNVQEELRLGTNRSRELDTSIVSAGNALRGVEVEALPAARQALATATSQKSQAESDVTRGERDERQWLLARDDRQSRVTEAERVLGLRRARVTEIESTITRWDRERATAVSRRAELQTENTSLGRKITTLQEKVTAQQTRIRELDANNTSLTQQIDAVEVRIAAALEVETVALGAFRLADAEATRLESDTINAQQAYAQAIATYQSERAAAVARAVAEARPAGAREGNERGNPEGARVGQGDGTREGSAEGALEGRQRDYAASLAAAHARALEPTVASGAMENAAQRAQRQADSNLQAAYDAGRTRGLGVGRTAGFTEGNNAVKEEEGRRNGYAVGKRRAETEAEASHRPLGRTRAEAEILAAPPQHSEERDATAENVSWFRALIQRGSMLLGWILPEAVADGSGGVIEENDVPATNFTYRNYVDSFPHADLVAAYREAYDAAYVASYTATYIDQYRIGYQAAYATHHQSAKAVALAVSYDDEKQRGERDGTARGTFDGLGFNSGRGQGFTEGKARGERTALDRGYALGEPQGHRENIAAAQAASEAAGRADVASDYRNNAKIRYVAESQKLEDANGNGKFEIGEGVTLSGAIRNFGGVAAARGTVRLDVTESSVRGIELTRKSIPLGEIPAGTQVTFKKLLVGTVKPAGEISLTGKVLYSEAEVASISVAQAIYAPYQVAFSYYYDGDAKLRVSSVGDGTGYHNAVWARSLGAPELLNGLEVAITPVTTGLVAVSWGGGSTAQWAPLNQRNGNWVYTGFFLSAYRSQGLSSNRFRVQLRKAGQVVFDQVVDAPIEIR